LNPDFPFEISSTGEVLLEVDWQLEGSGPIPHAFEALPGLHGHGQLEYLLVWLLTFPIMAMVITLWPC
jgi:hypothetical protein